MDANAREVRSQARKVRSEDVPPNRVGGVSLVLGCFHCTFLGEGRGGRKKWGEN